MVMFISNHNGFKIKHNHRTNHSLINRYKKRIEDLPDDVVINIINNSILEFVEYIGVKFYHDENFCFIHNNFKIIYNINKRKIRLKTILSLDMDVDDVIKLN